MVRPIKCHSHFVLKSWHWRARVVPDARSTLAAEVTSRLDSDWCQESARSHASYRQQKLASAVLSVTLCAQQFALTGFSNHTMLSCSYKRLVHYRTQSLWTDVTHYSVLSSAVLCTLTPVECHMGITQFCNCNWHLIFLKVNLESLVNQLSFLHTVLHKYPWKWYNCLESLL